MASMSDIFHWLDDDVSAQKTHYIMQTMWKDHSTNCDILGPHYTSAGTITSEFTYCCVMDATRKFHAYGVLIMYNHCSQVTALICDGASSNLMTVLSDTTRNQRKIFMLFKHTLRILSQEIMFSLLSALQPR